MSTGGGFGAWGFRALGFLGAGPREGSEESGEVMGSAMGWPVASNQVWSMGNMGEKWGKYINI